ncbi:MAG: Mur ligase family protein [Bacteroidota bacterium]
MKRIHFIAIGGSAMHNLALALSEKGYLVTGSDDEIYDPARTRLQLQGLLPEEMGWHPSRITHEIDTIILGMHARPDNPELAKATQLGINICSYPEYVYKQSRDKKRVVIGGSHGKTTTTAMILHVLDKLGVDADYLVGAQLPGFRNMVRLTDASIIIIEGDEYLSSPIHREPKFWYYRPHVAVLTGVAWDHINVFPTFENYEQQFSEFVNRIEKDGTLFWYKNDPSLQKILQTHQNNVKTSAYDTPEYNYTEKGLSIIHKLKTYPVGIFGIHNLQNLEAARLVCQKLGVTTPEFYNAISDFTGAAKRLETKGENGHSTVFLDFAHAPSKVEATVKAVKHRNPDRKLIAIFELHTFSSLNKEFLTQYANTLDPAETPIVYFSSHTLEMKKMPALSKTFVQNAFDNKNLTVYTEKAKLHNYLFNLNLQNTNLLLMSSGNFSKLDLPMLCQTILD